MIPPRLQGRKARDPAGLPAHRLDNYNPPVAFRGGAQTIDRFHDDVHGGVESEGKIGHHEVVVDRFRDADDRQLEVYRRIATPKVSSPPMTISAPNSSR